MEERVAIVGSRDWPDLWQVADYVRDLARRNPAAVVVSGAARGVDETAEMAGWFFGLTVVSLPARWRVNGVQNRRAGFERNSLIVAEATRVVAFWYRGSSGTADTIAKARAGGLPIELHRAA